MATPDDLRKLQQIQEDLDDILDKITAEQKKVRPNQTVLYSLNAMKIVHERAKAVFNIRQ